MSLSLPALSYISTSTSLLTTVILLIIVGSYLKLLKNYYSLKLEEKHLRSSVHKKEEALILKAQNQAKQLIDAAQKKSTAIVAETKAFNESSQKKLDLLINQATLDHIDQYKLLLEDVRAHIKILSTQTSKDIKNQSQQEIESFSASLKEEISRSNKAIQKTIQDTQANVQSQIKAYKNERQKAIDLAIFDLVSLVSQRVIGQVLTKKQHEQLVLTALEKAKKEKVFN